MERRSVVISRRTHILYLTYLSITVTLQSLEIYKLFSSVKVEFTIRLRMI